MQWKRFVSLLMVVCTLAMFGAGPVAGVAQAHESDTAPKAKYTVLIYMNGSSLETKGKAGTADLQELMKIGSGGGVNVVVETLGTRRWHLPQIAADRNQRWLVEKDNLKLVDDTVGLRRLDDPATLTDFITWGVSHYPADKYVLLFWDHGGGSIAGFGTDERHRNTGLRLDGIQKGISDAVSRTGARFELVGFDTCLLATIEMASLLSPFAGYMVGSQEIAPNNGWDYGAMLQALAANPAMDGAALGKAIADGYVAQSRELKSDRTLTLSVTDLAKVDGVVAALEGFAAAMATDVTDPQKLLGIARARSKAESYGTSRRFAYDMVDLSDLAKEASALYPAQSQALIDAVAAAVVHNVNSTGRPDARGLSVFFPFRELISLERHLTRYEQHTPFSATYKALVASFGRELFNDKVPVTFDSQTPVQVAGGGRAVEVKEEQVSQINQIYSILSRISPTNPNRLVFLAMDNDVEFDATTGKIEDSFDGSSVTLNGQFISLFVTSVGEQFNEYAIPIKLNGEIVELMVLYNFDTDTVEVVGAWPGVEEESEMAVKDLVKLKAGDRIQPLLYYYDTVTDEEGFEEGKEFILQGELEFGLSDLPPGEYDYGFMIVDLAGNESFSEFVTIVIEGAPPATPPSAAPPADPNVIKVVLNGQPLTFDVPPEIRNNRTLVPLRAIFEALGATITWDGATRTITATRGDMVIELQIDNAQAKRRGQALTLDQAPVLSNNRTLVPLRFVSESFGAEVKWDGATRTITITTP